MKSGIKEIITEICNLWRQRYWDINQLSSYSIRRFGSPLEELRLNELHIIRSELVQLNRKQAPINSSKELSIIHM